MVLLCRFTVSQVYDTDSVVAGVLSRSVMILWSVHANGTVEPMHRIWDSDWDVAGRSKVPVARHGGGQGRVCSLHAVRVMTGRHVGHRHGHFHGGHGSAVRAHGRHRDVVMLLFLTASPSASLREDDQDRLSTLLLLSFCCS